MKSEIIEIVNDRSTTLFKGDQKSANIVANLILTRFVKISEPKNEPEIMECITVYSGGRRGGSSRKLGNIFLSWKNLFEIVPDIFIAASGASVSNKYLTTMIGLYIWGKVWKGIQIEIDPITAMVFTALWDESYPSKKISEEDGFIASNKYIESTGELAISESDYADAINKLLAIGSIKMNAGVIRVVEWVRKKY
ncbi:hypothetical protein P3556_22725 [Vibrio parahaemolyticus]|uniref:hypothetical protein n=1 Tax=Vibrio TaxID=662 RepID=UPI0013312A31|nr:MULTISPECIES: hypothetical protein [Vibrio]EGR1569448.1 hypothetical protein [Vibrio parahaemolyticus]EIE7521256.1 hypothetical protein [Vibrio parahaemolyticus]EJC7971263.1 hypothetical protein [Vibrio parahaemolyticus]MCF6450943.1 hypothetical protein [Vibrio sp. MMG023]MDF4340888.1 hypothetical protein [Vibrio parahaemolyticus]